MPLSPTHRLAAFLMRYMKQRFDYQDCTDILSTKTFLKGGHIPGTFIKKSVSPLKGTFSRCFLPT